MAYKADREEKRDVARGARQLGNQSREQDAFSAYGLAEREHHEQDALSKETEVYKRAADLLVSLDSL